MPHDLSIVMHSVGYLPPLHSVRRVMPGPTDVGLIAHLGATGPLVTIGMSTTAPIPWRDHILVRSVGSADLRDSHDATVHLHLRLPKTGKARRRDAGQQRDAAVLEIRAFLDHWAGEPPPMNSTQEGQAIVQRIPEIEEAAAAAGAA